MRKNLVFGLLSVVVGALSALTGYGQLTSLTEGFDDSPSTLQSNGWVFINNSNPASPVTTPPAGSINFWAPGSLSTGIPMGEMGGTTSYIDVGFESGDSSVPGAIVSNWLITPLLTLEDGATFSFFTQETPTNTTLANDLQAWVSPNGSGTDVGSTGAVPGGDFTIKAVEVNPTFSLTGYPTAWQEYTFTITGLTGSTTGRIGFRYYLSDDFTQGTNIGIDTFTFADPPVFTRTVSGNWTDTTGWTPSGVPNGNTVTAQLVNPSSGTDTVDLGGGTFTLNQLQFSGTGAGSWDVVDGTIIFDGTSPTFVNQGGSPGVVGELPNLQLNANTTFEIDNASVVTEVTGAISGSGELIKTGSGTLELAGTNTYTGGTVVNAGTLQLGDGTNTTSLAGANGGTGSPGGAGTVAVTVNNSATFNVMTNATVTGGAGGAGSIVVGGNGGSGGNGGDAVTFSAGGSLSNSGTISGGAGGAGGEGVGATGGAGGAGAAAVSFSSGGALTNGGTISGGNGGNGGLGNGGGSNAGGTGGNGGAAVTFSAGGSLSNSGTISGGAGGAGGESVGGTNGANGTDGYGVVFTGAAGTLTNLSGGHINGGVSMDNFANAVTLEAGSVITGILNIGTSTTATLTLDGTSTQLYSTAVTGATTFNGALIKNGSGTWRLDQSFTYTGGTTINAGTLQIGNGGTAGSITGNVTDDNTLAFDRSDSVTFGGVVSGAGALVQMGSGTLILTLNNPFTGTTTINAGSTLQLGNGGTTGGVNSSSIIDNGVLVIDHNGDIFTYGGVVSGTGSGVKEGTGTLVLIAANTYTGGTTISGGTLQIGDGGTTGSIVGNVTDNAALVFDRSDNVTFSGAISGTGSLTQNGGGTLVLTGTNTYGGGTTISAGTLQIGSGSTSGSITGDVTDNGTLAFDRSDSVTFAGVISGTGGLVQLGIGGTLILTGTNTYSGGTSFSAGILAVANDGNLGTGPLNFNGGTLEALAAGGGITSAKAVTLNAGGGTFLADTGTSSTFSGVINGVGSLTTEGPGTLTLTGVNTYSGGTSFNAGILAVDNDRNLGTGPLNFNGGTLEALAAGGGITSATTVTLNAGGGRFLADTGTSSTFSGVINGVGSLTMEGPGTLTLTSVNTYTGGTSFNAGILAVENDRNLGTGPLNFNESTLEALAAGGPFNSAKAVTLNAGGGTFLADAGTSSTLDGVISGLGSLTMEGPGTLTLTGVNTYSGGTSFNTGILAVENDANLGTGPLNFNGGTLEALAAGGGITSAKAVTLNAGGGTFLADAGTSSTLSGVIS